MCAALAADPRSHQDRRNGQPVEMEPDRLFALPRVIPNRPGRPEWGETAAPMRALTRAIAMETGAWTPDRAHQIAELFDSSATAWRERDTPERHDALADALARGGFLVIASVA
jgi:hypothetical protein